MRVLHVMTEEADAGGQRSHSSFCWCFAKDGDLLDFPDFAGYTWGKWPPQRIPGGV